MMKVCYVTHFPHIFIYRGSNRGNNEELSCCNLVTQIALGLNNPHICSMARLKNVVGGMKRLTNEPIRKRLPNDTLVGLGVLLMECIPAKERCDNVVVSLNVFNRISCNWEVIVPSAWLNIQSQ